MSEKLTVHGVYERASCPDHPLSIKAADLDGAETLVALGGCGDTFPNDEYRECGSYCDSESFALARLKDLRYVAIEESSDSTGHGCQCSGTANIYPTLDDALRLGLSKENRKLADAILKRRAKGRN